LTTDAHEPPVTNVRNLQPCAVAVQIAKQLYRKKLATKERLAQQPVYDHEDVEIAAPESKSSRDPRSKGIAGPSSGAFIFRNELLSECKTKADGSQTDCSFLLTPGT
jgi:hypothetical protein